MTSASFIELILTWGLFHGFISGGNYEFKNNDESVYVPKITFQKDMEQLEGMIQGAEESGDNLARLYQDEYNGLVKQHSEMKRLESIIYNLKTHISRCSIL